MNFKEVLYFFVAYIFPLLVLIVGSAGNALGFRVVLSKKLTNIGPRDTYKYLFLTDQFYLFQIIGTYLQYTYGLNVQTISLYSCKIWNYINYSFASISPWLIVYISLDRYVSIVYPSKRFTLRKKSTQIIWYVFSTVMVMAYYLPVYLFYELQQNEPTNNTEYSQLEYSCNFQDQNAVLLISYMDLIIRVLVPFVLMLLMSVLLSYSLFSSRKRLVENFLAEENETFYKEIRLAASSICLNIVYIFTQLPISITVFYLGYSTIAYQFSYYLFYLSYAINFYIILPTNSHFRTGFFKLFE